MHIWYSVCQWMCVRRLEGGQRGRACPFVALSLSDLLFQTHTHVCHANLCVRVLYFALYTHDLPVYRMYRKAPGKRQAACSGDEARTLWCVLSLQWRGSSN